MKKLGYTVCVPLAGFLLLACDAWQFKPGVVMVSGGTNTILKEANGRLLTVHGSRRISATELAEVSVYHALIFYPEAPIIGGGSGMSNNGPVSTETVTWQVRKHPPEDYNDVEEKKLEIKYHAIDETVNVGSETFSIRDGNLFIVRLNESWLPAVTQIKAHFKERAEKEKVLKFLKSVLRGDEAIQKLEFY